MKKKFILSTVLLLSITTAGCSSKTSSLSNQSKEQVDNIVAEDIIYEEGSKAKEEIQKIKNFSIDTTIELTNNNAEEIALRILKAKYELDFTVDYIEPNFTGDGYVLTVRPKKDYTSTNIAPLTWYFEISDTYNVRCDYDNEFYKYQFTEYYNEKYKDIFDENTYMYAEVMLSNDVKPLEVFFDNNLDTIIKNNVQAIRFIVEHVDILNYINTDEAIALANAMLKLSKSVDTQIYTEIQSYGIVITPNENDINVDNLTDILSYRSLVANPIADPLYVILNDNKIYLNGELYGDNIVSSTANEDINTGKDTTPIYYLDETSVNLTNFKSMDVSGIFDMSKFTFDIPSELNTTTNEKYNSISDWFLIYTTDDIVMLNGKAEMNAFLMTLPSATELKYNKYYIGKTDAEIKDMVKTYIKEGQGKDAYDIKITEQNGYKILSFKYIGSAVGNSNINGRIDIFYTDEKVIQSANNSGKDINKYLDKYIEITYYSPQSSISTERFPLEDEIKAFDKFFDNMVDSITVKP